MMFVCLFVSFVAAFSYNLFSCSLVTIDQHCSLSIRNDFWWFLWLGLKNLSPYSFTFASARNLGILPLCNQFNLNSWFDELLLSFELGCNLSRSWSLSKTIQGEIIYVFFPFLCFIQHLDTSILGIFFFFLRRRCRSFYFWFILTHKGPPFEILG